MSVRHSPQALNQSSGQDAPLFLGVSTGDFVIVEAVSRVAPKVDGNWWMGQVLFCEGGARDPMMNTMFQVSDVDDGFIYWVNGNEVMHIVRSLDGFQLGFHGCVQLSMIS